MVFARIYAVTLFPIPHTKMKDTLHPLAYASGVAGVGKFKGPENITMLLARYL